jgi:site-specific recombinase XerD
MTSIITLNADHICAFLNHLATKCHFSASSQSQALNALGFLYKQVLNKDLGDLSILSHIHHKQFLPAVLSESEVKRLFEQLSGVYWIIGMLLYGSGLLVRVQV